MCASLLLNGCANSNTKETSENPINKNEAITNEKTTLSWK